MDLTAEERSILAGSLGDAPRRALEAFIFGVTNPVMVQGAVFAGIPITAGWTPHPREVVKTGDWVRVDPGRKLIELL